MMSDLAKAERQPSAMGLPATDSIPRRPGSIRRTSHIDMHMHGHELVLDGAARDLVTSTSGTRVVDIATVRAHLDDTGRLATLDIGGAVGPTDALIGRLVGVGFRDAVHAAFPERRKIRLSGRLGRLSSRRQLRPRNLVPRADQL